jgi:hypothetical protein
MNRRPTRILLLAGLATVILAPAIGHAKKKKPNVTKALSVEIIELGSATRKHVSRYVVPLDGRVAGVRVDGEKRRHCVIESKPRAEGRIELNLRCREEQPGSPDEQLEVRAARQFEAGASVVIGELARDEEGARVRVVVTRL